MCLPWVTFRSSAPIEQLLKYCVLTDPSTNLVERLIGLFLKGLAYTSFLHAGITARLVASLVSSSFNRPLEDNYARKNRT
jgi:hypothetical protein